MTALILTDGAPQWTIPTGADVDVYGTAGQDALAFGTGSNVALDASFNAGNDVIYLEGDSTDFTVSNSGATVTLTDGSGNTIVLPAGTTGQTLIFGDGALDLMIDGGAVMLGDQTVDGTDTAVTATVDDTQTSDSQFGEAPAPAASFSISDATVAEDAGTATFTVTLSDAPGAGESVTVDYATADGTATAGTDYTAATGTLTFGEGVTTQTFTVDITDDLVVEDDETFTVTLSNATGIIDETAATISDAEATGTITNDDEALTFELAADADSTLEGNIATFTVTANRAVTEDTAVTFTVSPGDVGAADQGTSTTNMNDFTAGTFNPSVVTIAAGATTATFTVAGANDGLTELPETYSVTAAISGQDDMSVDSSLLDGAGTFTLTTGTDSGAAYTGGVANDTFNAGDIAGGATWTTGDQIDGGAGDDVFNVSSDGAVTTPVGATVANIETASILAGTTASNVNTSTWAGLTTFNFTGVTAITATSGAATDMNITGTTATDDTIVNGGNNVSVTNTGATNAGATGISIGATTAAGGTVTVNSTTLAATGTGNDIAVKGGTTVDITQVAGNVAGDTFTSTAGAVTVTGNASTTEVTVTDTADGTASTTVVGHTNGAVTINDVNKASNTDAGTIATVTLNNFAAATVDSSAISTVNLTGTATSMGIGRGDLTATPTDNTLALNVSGLTMTGALTDSEAAATDDGFKIVNLSSTGTASTVGSLALADATNLNISGDAKFTSAAETLTSVTDIVVTNTAGGVLGSEIGTAVSFTGGAGDDGVGVGATTKTIDMGAGDDTVTYGGVVTTTGGGSVNAGDGEDTIVMSGGEADAADATSVFNSTFTNFEVLSIETGATETVDAAGINGITKVRTIGSTSLTVNNIATDATLTLTGTSTKVTMGIANATFNADDRLNVVLENSAATATPVAFGEVEAAGVEIVEISTVDKGTTAVGNTDATIDTATLTATSATSVAVSGNNGLTLTNTGNVKITSFDASGVIGDGSTDTAANLAVTFTGANTTTTADVTITGGAGDDVLTGSASKDTIAGGDGGDTLSGLAGIDILSGGAGDDTLTVAGASQSDTLTGGDGVDGFSFADSTGTSVAVDFAAMLKISAGTTAVTSITDFVAGTDKIDLNLTNGGWVSGTSMTVATAQTVAYADTLAAVYGGVTAITASIAGGALHGVVVTVSAGVEAGTYLYVNDETAGVAAADDMLIEITGITGTLADADFTFA